jgi:C4-dicarboxylate-binding protein DctP
VVTNQRFWQHLQPDDRALIDQALQESLAFANQIADAQNEQALQALRQAGTTRIHKLDTDQRARLAQGVQPVQQQLANRIAPHWMSDLKQALRKA